MTLTILPCPQNDPHLLELLATHKAFAIANTPAESGHAIAPGEALPRSLHYYLAMEADEALGCVGLMEIASGHGEIKSMHVRDLARGKGIGGLLLETALESARMRGLSRISLETGAGDSFAASRRLYARYGFAECAPFGAYREDPFSVCMTREV